VSNFSTPNQVSVLAKTLVPIVETDDHFKAKPSLPSIETANAFDTDNQGDEVTEYTADPSLSASKKRNRKFAEAGLPSATQKSGLGKPPRGNFSIAYSKIEVSPTNIKSSKFFSSK